MAVLAPVGQNLTYHISPGRQLRVLPPIALAGEGAPGVQTAQRLRIPVVIGDSSNEETLRSAGVQRCQSVLAITNGDITNLESAMVVRDLSPEARITMRMFDHDLAQRVERQLGLGHSRSVSMLVAPAIAA